jgi:hypothetical protein
VGDVELPGQLEDDTGAGGFGNAGHGLAFPA